MKAIEVVGPDGPATTEFVADLVDRLGDRGRVGTVRHRAAGVPDGGAGEVTAPASETNATATYEVGPAGWAGSGEDATLGDVLDRVAPRCAYCVVDGHGATTLPQVVLDGTGDDEALVSESSPDDVAVGDVITALETVDPYETLESLVARVKASPDAELSGAIATFTGRVRAREHPDDEPTEYLEFERYDEVAAETMAEIEQDLASRDGVFEVELYHKTGVVEAGADIVHVVVLAGHRREAFETVEDGINRLKAEVPLFKKEVTVSDEFWAHER